MKFTDSRRLILHAQITVPRERPNNNVVEPATLFPPFPQQYSIPIIARRSSSDRLSRVWYFSSTRFPVLRNLCPSFLFSFSLFLSLFLSLSFFYEYKRVRALVSSTIISIMRLMVKCKSFNKCNIVRPSQKSVRNRECTDLLRGSRISFEILHRMLWNPVIGKDLAFHGRGCAVGELHRIHRRFERIAFEMHEEYVKCYYLLIAILRVPGIEKQSSRQKKGRFVASWI